MPLYRGYSLPETMGRAALGSEVKDVTNPGRGERCARILQDLHALRQRMAEVAGDVGLLRTAAQVTSRRMKHRLSSQLLSAFQAALDAADALKSAAGRNVLGAVARAISAFRNISHAVDSEPNELMRANLADLRFRADRTASALMHMQRTYSNRWRDYLDLGCPTMA